MNKIIEFLKQSNRYKHLIGGLLVGILAFTPWTALYAAAVAASCLELKDKLKGGLWDWIDWSLTVIGGILSAIFWWRSFPIVRVVYRGYNNANANGGVSNANANNDASNTNANVGSRLEI